MFSNKLNYKLFNITLLMLLLYIGFSNIGLWWMIITKVLSILSPFIVAFIFSYVFVNSKTDLMISFIITFLLAQVLPFIFVFFVTCFRFIGLKCDSPCAYKFSLFFTIQKLKYYLFGINNYDDIFLVKILNMIELYNAYT